MATCDKCNNDFFNKECPHCKKEETKNYTLNKQNDKICNSCEKSFRTIECVPCRDGLKNIYKNNAKNKTKSYQQLKEEKYKTKKNPLMIVIAIGVSFIALMMFRNLYIEYKQEQQVMQMFYGTTDYDEVEKINKDMMKEVNKMNKDNKSIMEMNKDMMKQVNGMFGNK